MARGQGKRMAAMLRRYCQQVEMFGIGESALRGPGPQLRFISSAAVNQAQRSNGRSLGGFNSSAPSHGFDTFATQKRAVSVESLERLDRFAPRHNALSPADEKEMLAAVGAKDIDDLMNSAIPKSLPRLNGLELGIYTKGMSESEFLEHFKEMANKNKVAKSFIGMGYYGTHTPQVILRNLLENPGWYTQYTPYQSEIAQGRLESLLNFQTMVADLTGMEMSNASLLDEATAAAEAMTMSSAIAKGKRPRFLVADNCHPQTIAVCQSRADGLGLTVDVVPPGKLEFAPDVCGALVQYPATDGLVEDYAAVAEAAHAAGANLCVATDLLSLTLLKPPGEWGADIVIGSAQRMGVPMGYGGPHAAFLACAQKQQRLMPGRIIAISRDAQGKPAMRMAMQTREQHIRRDKATSNICTAQALLANIAAMYGVYHGPEGLTKIAERCRAFASVVAAGAAAAGHKVIAPPGATFFDTVCIDVGDADAVVASAAAAGMNLRRLNAAQVTVSVDETTTLEDVEALLGVLGGGGAAEVAEGLGALEVPEAYKRTSKFMQNSVFHQYHSEHDMLRYLKHLENRDLSLCHSMIPLGSCTMKLNGTVEMAPISWPELANIHPFAPVEQAQGYKAMFDALAQQLCEITQFDSVSLQPNAGASGEYAGLMSIRAYHAARGEGHRNICIVPTSAHGTNPASAVMCGMKVVIVQTKPTGEVDMEDFKAAVEKHKDNLAAFMITYPSTYGLFDAEIQELCSIIHENGGQVYMDGANMNAQVGVTAPGILGADVCHLNLHKTFCIPHGGGGPGMGPIGVKAHLAPFLPSHPIVPTSGLPVPSEQLQPFGTMAAAPFGSSLILPISFAYISLMGSDGLVQATQQAVLAANYMKEKLGGHYPVLYENENGRCAHEFIIDLRDYGSFGITPDDVAKRLIDYGFHGPTMSWPVPGTLMIEPTESEPKKELDRFVEAMIAIRGEIEEVATGAADAKDNVLKNAPHPMAAVVGSEWSRPYSRERAAFPVEGLRERKFWPTASRVDNVYGDRTVVPRWPKDA